MPVDAVDSGADITIASTTETQAELDHATGPDWRKPFSKPEAAAEKTGEASDKKGATKTEAGSDPATTEAKSGDDAEFPAGAKKRIDKLTARLKATEEELAAARRGEKPASARDTTQQSAKPATETDPEPKVKDFKSWDEWNVAHTRWAVRDEQRKLDAKNSEAAQKAADQETYDAHLSRVQSFAGEHDDFETSVKDMGKFEFASPQSNMAFQLAIVEDDNGPAILYHLSKNPDEMAKFEGLSPVKVQLLLGRISAKLNPESQPADKKDKAEASTEAKSKAPAPAGSVRRSAAAPATDLADPKMDTDEWIRKRNEQERNRKRR